MPRRRHPLWCALLLAGARGSTVLAPAPARELQSTTLEFFGPQHFTLNASGSALVELGAARLARIYRDGRVADDALAGAVVTFRVTDLPRPSLEWLYVSLERAGVTAAIAASSLTKRPGAFYHAHDGTRGVLTRRGRMPMLQVGWDDVRKLHALDDAERARGARGVRLLLAPSENEWVLFWASWPWVLFIRVVMPLLAFATGFRAAGNLRAHVELGGRGALWPPTKPVVVLCVEMVVCPILGVVYAGGPHGSSSVWDLSATRFFFTGLAGFGLFTTLLMAMHWRTESGRLRDGAVHAKNTDFAGPALLFVLTVGVDAVFSALAAANVVSPNNTMFPAAVVLYTLAQFCASFYFFYAAWSVRAGFHVVASPHGTNDFPHMCAGHHPPHPRAGRRAPPRVESRAGRGASHARRGSRVPSAA